jgi:dihydrofolate reductase
MKISMIVAMSEKFLIGTETGLPWHLPSDLKRFRKLTIGKPVIVGRKTLEVIGGPLPGRPHIVLTHQKDYEREGCIVAHSIEEAIQKAKRLLPELQKDEIMVIGGAEVYRAAMPHVECVYVTIVEGEFQGVTYLPQECRVFLGPTWRKLQEEFVPVDERNLYLSRFFVYEKNN